MKRLGFAILLVSTVAFAKNAYMDNKLTVTHDCDKDPVASIMGNENTITFTGKCGDISVMGNKNTVIIATAAGVSVTGNENTVTVDTVAKLATTGSKNTVSWKKAASGDKPTTRNTGKDNKITQAK
jgi:hypothetical protein